MTHNLNEIKTWIFDLDNTLYPASSNLFDQISKNMTRYIVRELKVNFHDAYVIQKTYFKEYGTTMRGLMKNHHIDPNDFLEFVHNIDLSIIEKNNEALNQALERLPGEKVIFTNGSKRHAENVTSHLGIHKQFKAIFDIVDANFTPKPEKRIYKVLLEKLNIDPCESVMVEDMARNLIPASQLGMTTIWIKSDLEWALNGFQSKYIDYTIDDLTSWIGETSNLISKKSNDLD